MGLPAAWQHMGSAKSPQGGAGPLGPLHFQGAGVGAGLACWVSRAQVVPGRGVGAGGPSAAWHCGPPRWEHWVSTGLLHIRSLCSPSSHCHLLRNWGWGNPGPGAGHVPAPAGSRPWLGWAPGLDAVYWEAITELPGCLFFLPVGDLGCTVGSPSRLVPPRHGCMGTRATPPATRPSSHPHQQGC